MYFSNGMVITQRYFRYRHVITVGIPVNVFPRLFALMRVGQTELEFEA